MANVVSSHRMRSALMDETLCPRCHGVGFILSRQHHDETGARPSAWTIVMAAAYIVLFGLLLLPAWRQLWSLILSAFNRL
jgi:hypothetical protein